jgi:acyl-CoA synthetase (AMP-forming)/AMP-acid ligase II
MTGRRTELRTDGYVDSAGTIALPDEMTLVSNLLGHIAEYRETLAYRYLDYTRAGEGLAVELTWRQFGARLRSVGARLQQVTSPGIPGTAKNRAST